MSKNAPFRQDAGLVQGHVFSCPGHVLDIAHICLACFRTLDTFWGH